MLTANILNGPICIKKDVYKRQVEAHINKFFGNYDNVFHELYSPDIHVDICVIKPTPERNYYTLVTMGAGAHRMNVPKEIQNEKLDRAEMMICLPPDWKIGDSQEDWYWPLRWLKIDRKSVV